MFGEKLLGQNVRVSVLYELTAPSVPEAAREEAKEHESLYGSVDSSTLPHAAKPSSSQKKLLGPLRASESRLGKRAIFN
jgi:hypothetical protein